MKNWSFSQDWVHWACLHLGISDVNEDGMETGIHSAQKVELQALVELALEHEVIDCITAIRGLPTPEDPPEAALGHKAAISSVLALLQARMAARPQFPFGGTVRPAESVVAEACKSR